MGVWFYVILFLFGLFVINLLAVGGAELYDWWKDRKREDTHDETRER
jgi:hypothetical protein